MKSEPRVFQLNLVKDGNLLVKLSQCRHETWKHEEHHVVRLVKLSVNAKVLVEFDRVPQLSTAWEYRCHGQGPVTSGSST